MALTRGCRGKSIVFVIVWVNIVNKRVAWQPNHTTIAFLTFQDGGSFLLSLDLFHVFTFVVEFMVVALEVEVYGGSIFFQTVFCKNDTGEGAIGSRYLRFFNSIFRYLSFFIPIIRYFRYPIFYDFKTNNSIFATFFSHMFRFPIIDNFHEEYFMKILTIK